MKKTINTIICHSFPAWDTPYVKSTVELIKRLSADYRLIFIDYHYTWKDVFKNPYAPSKQLLGFSSRYRKVNTRYGEIEIYQSAPIIPVNWINSGKLFDFISNINSRIIRGTIRRILKRVNPEETALINAFNPIYGVLTDKNWSVAKKVYYCYDEISGTEWSGKWGSIFEQRYLEQVDCVITTSSRLQELKSKVNPHCQTVKNGVDLEIFKSPLLTKTRNKRIGYLGACDSRLNYDLIYELAENCSGYQFDFLGPVKVDGIVERFAQLRNVRFLGAKQQSELPEWINSLDACIIPFVKNELTAAIYPLKINEYLAMGKPVVSTGFSDLSDFDELISIADTSADFKKQLMKEMKANNRLKIQKRIDFAQENSWEARAREFAQIIEAA